LQPHLLFICTAIGFSWSGFVLIFSGEPSMRPTYAVQSTIATSIFLGSIGFAFADRSILLGGTITFCGMIIAFLLHQRLSYAWSTLIATACFAAYLNGAML
jgi:hypothetical protein